jgi:hypothetical protein
MAGHVLWPVEGVERINGLHGKKIIDNRTLLYFLSRAAVMPLLCFFEENSVG